MLNLLSNAIKFTPTGGEVRVRVGWTAGGGQYISIKDNGPGIPEDEIPIVLSAFGQGSIAIKSAEQGTGLGLPIVQGLLAMHGGEFELHSKLREGTEAIAIFPLSRVMEELPAAADEGRGGRAPALGRRTGRVGRCSEIIRHAAKAGEHLHRPGSAAWQPTGEFCVLLSPQNCCDLDFTDRTAFETTALRPQDTRADISKKAP